MYNFFELSRCLAKPTISAQLNWNFNFRRYHEIHHNCRLLNFSAVADAQTDKTQNLPVNLKNIVGEWSCKRISTDKEFSDGEHSGTYKTKIAVTGLQEIKEITTSIRTKHMAEAAILKIKSDMKSLYELDNGQLTVKIISGTFTHVEPVLGAEVIPSTALEKIMQSITAKAIHEKTKIAIRTLLLTKNLWLFSTGDFTTSCTKA